jgi:hypothetical protein
MCLLCGGLACTDLSGYVAVAVKLQTSHSQLTLYGCKIPNVFCVVPPEDEQVTHETCRGPSFWSNEWKVRHVGFTILIYCTMMHGQSLYWHTVMHGQQNINFSTPKLSPSAQRCLTRFFTGNFASWTLHFVNICVKNQQNTIIYSVY